MAAQGHIPQPNASKDVGTSFLSAWQQRDEKQGFSDQLLDLIAARFRLLGEPLRLKLLAGLVSGERNVGELVTLTGAGQANVSKHLAALTQGGLVSRRKVGVSTYYAIADPTAYTLCDVVCAGIQERLSAQVHALGLSAMTREHGNAKIALEGKEDMGEAGE
jgi:ArsR family transcriptional regulator